MKFSEFLNRLYSNSNTSSQERYVRELFSALCGDSDPFSSNKPSYAYSCNPTLPKGLQGKDESYRKRFYKEDHKGLSNPIKEHIRRCVNKETFISYLDKTVPPESFAKLCEAFGVSVKIARNIMFERIYEQFMRFVNNKNDETECIISDCDIDLSGGSQTIKEQTIVPQEDKAKADFKAEPKRMSEIFICAIHDFNIEGFIEQEPTNTFRTYVFDDAKQFVGRISYNQKDELTLDKDEDYVCNMIEFTNILSKYIEYLMTYMTAVRNFENEDPHCFGETHLRHMEEIRSFTNVPPKPFYVHYEPPKNNKEFESRTLQYRDQLKSILKDTLELIETSRKQGDT